MGAIALIPVIASAAPQALSLIEGLLSLIHKAETKPGKVIPASTIPSSAGHPAEPIAVPAVTVPATGAEKKATVMDEFETIALPFLAPLFSAILKRQVDSAVLMPIASRLVDDIVALNNALGVFTS